MPTPSYPSNVATVVVTRTWTKSDGSGHPASGTVTFTPNAVLEDGTSTPPVGLLPTPLTAVLDANGSISVTVIANDDPHLSPAGWSYIVTENIAGYPTQTYLQQFKAADSPVDLATLAPLATPPAMVAYVATSAVGAAGGVASLDGTGNVPLSQLGNAPSGGGGGTPSSTVVAETSYGQASAAGAATTYSRGDHTHGTPALASAAASTSAVGDTATAGTATTPARSDHTHGRETFGAVTAQTSFGAASSNGVAATVARSDHSHGTPAAPTLSGLGGVPTSRLVTAGTGLTGGGDLTADRTLAVVANSTNQQVQVALGGTLVGTRHEVNLIQGSGATLTVTDNAASDRVDVTIAASGGGGSVPSGLSADAAMLGLSLISAGVENATEQFALNAGVLGWVMVRATAANTLTNLGVLLGAQQGVTSTGVNGLAVYSAAGALLGRTVDMTTQFSSAPHTWVEAALQASVGITADTNYYLAVLSHFSTAPQIRVAGSGTLDLVPINGVRTSVYLTSQADFPANFDPTAASVNSVKYLLTAR